MCIEDIFDCGVHSAGRREGGNGEKRVAREKEKVWLPWYPSHDARVCFYPGKTERQ